MIMFKRHIINFILLNIVISVFLLVSTLITNYLSVFVIGIINLLLGYLILYSFTEKIDKKTLFIFLEVFIVFLIYAFLCQLLTIENPSQDTFVYPDQAGFYRSAKKISEEPLNTLFLNTFSNYEYSGSPLFYFFTSLIYKLSIYIDNSSILNQISHVVVFSALIAPFLYKTLLYYFDSSKALTYTRIYAYLTFPLFYSASFLRDPHIALFFGIGIFLIHNPGKYTYKNLLKLIIVFLGIFFLRSTQGLFFLLIISIFIYLNFPVKVKYLLFTSLIIVGLFVYDNFVNFLIKDMIDLHQRYTERAFEQASEGSLGIKLKKLPAGISNLSIFLWSQIRPFPFTRVLIKNGEFTLLRLPEAWAGISWFFIWTVLLTNLRKIKYILNNYKYLKYLIIITITFILLLTFSSTMIRRMYGMYPSIYILGMIIISNYNRSQKKLLLSIAYIAYFVLFVIYIGID